MSEFLTRHSLADRVIHWLNAVLWLLLFFTGMALLGAEHAPLGQGYSNAVRALVGGGDNLLALHITLGIVWIIALLGYTLTNYRAATFFLRQVFSVGPGDLTWLARKPFVMALGRNITARLGLPTDLPPQGYYNFGQKAFGMLSVVGSLVLALTGIVLAGSALGMAPEAAVLWAVFLHFLAAGLVFIGLLIHVYMAALVKEERPGFFSMFSGVVPRDYALHHHELWVKEGGKSS